LRLYLSSYQIGDCPETLSGLLGENRRAALIANALDPYLNPQESREARLTRQAAALERLGCASEELDLRDYFGQYESLADRLSEFGLVWVHGGNSFVLKRAFEQSGCERILADMLKRDAIVYGGFSAALMMVTPTMRGIDLCDDIDTVPEGYRREFSWDCMGLISYSIVPHYRSGHPESAMMEDVVRYMDEHRMPYRTLRDGEAIVVDGDSERLVGRHPDV